MTVSHFPYILFFRSIYGSIWDFFFQQNGWWRQKILPELQVSACVWMYTRKQAREPKSKELLLVYSHAAASSSHRWWRERACWRKVGDTYLSVGTTKWNRNLMRHGPRTLTLQFFQLHPPYAVADLRERRTNVDRALIQTVLTLLPCMHFQMIVVGCVPDRSFSLTGWF